MSAKPQNIKKLQYAGKIFQYKSFWDNVKVFQEKQMYQYEGNDIISWETS